MNKDKQVKTTLHNILSHIVCAIDYGYYDNVLMLDFADMIVTLSEEEIENYIESSKSDQHSEEDYEVWRQRINEWKRNFLS